MSSPEAIKRRSEVLFLYDVKYCNPNGDPIDENKPRIDEETGKNYVTDVRLKRTIRDYLYDYMNKDIFIRERRTEDGKLKSKDEIVEEKEMEGEDDLLEYIDIRLFGATTAIEGNTIVYTGPVQFNFGRSLHRVKLEYVKGTTVMPSQEGKTQGTMTDMYVLPYSLIGFYGVVNENAAQYTKLTAQDVKIMLEAAWKGTQSLATRSKLGHTPRLLVQVEYNKNADGFFIGDLLSSLKLNTDKEDEQIRECEDYSLDISKFTKLVLEHKDKINCIKFKKHNDVKLEFNEELESLMEELQF